MVRLILTGGLGNQMFEYATAKSLALRLNKKLEIDLYALNKKTKGTKRNLELQVFDLDLTICSSWRTPFFVKAYPLVRNHQTFFRKFGYFRDGSAIVYAKEFENLKGNTILHGHFQNEKYFKNYADEIRKDFTFRRVLKGKNVEIEKEINSTNSVAIHIRRGDYLSNEQAKNNFSVCSKKYYEKATIRIKELVNSPHFFIFSEDFDWIQENLTFGNSPVTYIDWNKREDSYVDMQLMSLCKHNIIANSSFSWWAAWLNANEQKYVFAPSEWFKVAIRNKDLINFYPQGWIIIE